jgi:hypothetical protein
MSIWAQYALAGAVAWIILTTLLVVMLTQGGRASSRMRDNEK